MPLYPLSDLSDTLQGYIPARNNVPSAEQYQQAIKDAILDFSQRIRLERHGTLAIVSNVSNYDLPTDYIADFKLDPLPTVGDIILSDSGLVPAPAGYQIQPQIVDSQVILGTPPTFNITLGFTYTATYSLDQDDNYNLPDTVKYTIMLKAQAIVLQAQANVAAREGWSYGTGSARVDKQRLAPTLQNQAIAMEQQYLEATQLMERGSQHPITTRAYTGGF